MFSIQTVKINEKTKERGTKRSNSHRRGRQGLDDTIRETGKGGDTGFLREGYA